MKLYNFSYFIRESFESIIKHRFMSFAAMSVITACLLLMGSFMLVAFNIENLLGEVEDKNEIIAFVDESYTQEQAVELKAKILELDDVSQADFISKEQALKDFKKEFGEQSGLLDDLEEDNPLRHRFRIKLDNIRGTARTEQALYGIGGIARVSARSDIADRIIQVRDVATVICLVLIIILVLVSIFIISNTVNLTLFNRREEIAIMKMVGATNGFIRCPFIIEGLLLGIGGAAIALALQWGVYEYVSGLVVKSLQFFPIVSFNDALRWLALTFFSVGIFVGGLGSGLTLRKFLKV